MSAAKLFYRPNQDSMYQVGIFLKVNISSGMKCSFKTLRLTCIIFLPYLEAQKLVEDMEKERRKLDKQLDLVQEKTKRAYLSQEILEAKMKVTNNKFI